MTVADRKITIIGAGPTGLGAASYLEESGADWILLEQHSYPGGLSASFEANGFTWDIGGHIYFSHYPEYDKFLDSVLPEADWGNRSRNAFVNLSGDWVPYPFQNNIGRLCREQSSECLKGLIRLYTQNIEPSRRNFKEFILTHFGEGICRLFMEPYNSKIWAHPLDSISTDWLGERVARVDLEQAIFNVLNPGKSESWGPNNTFRVPVKGGTGEIWRRCAEKLPAGQIHYLSKVEHIDAKQRTVYAADGQGYAYSHLVNTMPLDSLIAVSNLDHLLNMARQLDHTTVYVVGLGLRLPVTQMLKHKCWVYFPEEYCPFYRATIFSNYSDANVPEGTWSLMLEVSASRFNPVDNASLIDRCIAACVKTGMFRNSMDVVHTWSYCAEYGYPVPTLKRDSILEILLTELEEYKIYSRGRFGAWKYEVGNMDHSYMQGREVARRILHGSNEQTIHHPEQVNRARSR